jgi:hypothetical protein
MENQIIVHRVDELQIMAQAMAETKMFGFKTKQEAFALMLIAQAEGRHPATIAQDYDVIQGRPALKSLAAQARFQLAGGVVNWIQSNATCAEAEFSHPRGGKLVIFWDMKRASDAGLSGKDNWKKYPDQMLRARCAAEGARAVFPACLNGMYVSEEVQDFEPKAEPRAKLDPRKSVDQVPPPPPPASRPKLRDVDPVAYMAKLRDKYDKDCVGAAQTMERALPEDFESEATWDEQRFIDMRAKLADVIEAHNAEQAGGAA